MQLSKLTRWTFFAVIFAVAFSFLAVDASAQKKRRKKTVRPSVSSAPVLPPQSEPLIISRAEDFPDSGATPLPVVNNDDLPRPTNDLRSFDDLEDRIKSLENSKKTDYDTRQKRLMLNLDILTKAEQRADSLRKQSFDLAEKESNIKMKLDSVDIDARPETIERTVAFAGTLRPEELRAARKKSLDAEKVNLQTMLALVQQTKANVDQNVTKADMMVEKLRVKLEKEIDDALVDEEKP